MTTSHKQPGFVAGKISLAGVIDLHVHTAPDVRPRRLDDLALAREAAAAGMRAVLLKSHHTLTADRAALAESQVENIRVFGGVALNEAVGGLNPAAVETALALGAKEIWLPTLSAANHLQATGSSAKGICILDETERLRPVVFEILELVAQGDIILGTGHLSVQEIEHLIPAARAAGVKRILVTHPELPLVNMPISMQQALAGPDVFFERCLFVTLFQPQPVPLPAIAAATRQVGPETTVMATDFGQVENPSPIAGMRHYITEMLALGFSQAEIDRMTRVNPAELLGLS
jgi:hypothetical protein